MPNDLKQLETEKLRELVAALSRSSAYWSLESAYNDIVAIGSELLRRESGDFMSEAPGKHSATP